MRGTAECAGNAYGGWVISTVRIMTRPETPWSQLRYDNGCTGFPASLIVFPNHGEQKCCATVAVALSGARNIYPTIERKTKENLHYSRISCAVLPRCKITALRELSLSLACGVSGFSRQSRGTGCIPPRVVAHRGAKQLDNGSWRSPNPARSPVNLETLGVPRTTRACRAWNHKC